MVRSLFFLRNRLRGWCETRKQAPEDNLSVPFAEFSMSGLLTLRLLWRRCPFCWRSRDSLSFRNGCIQRPSDTGRVGQRGLRSAFLQIRVKLAERPIPGYPFHPDLNFRWIGAGVLSANDRCTCCAPWTKNRKPGFRWLSPVGAFPKSGQSSPEPGFARGPNRWHRHWPGRIRLCSISWKYSRRPFPTLLLKPEEQTNHYPCMCVPCWMPKIVISINRPSAEQFG